VYRLLGTFTSHPVAAFLSSTFMVCMSSLSKIIDSIGYANELKLYGTAGTIMCPKSVQFIFIV